MKKLILLVVLLFSAHLKALVPSDLESGDIILFSLNCMACRVIESETNSKFSHSGVVIRNAEGEVRVAQALGNVHHTTLEQFKKYMTPGTALHIYRPKEFLELNTFQRKVLDQALMETFEAEFAGLPFDGYYLWDNYNSKGEEMIYCSELLTKLLDRFLSEKSVLFPITYKKNWDYWYRVFKGNVPEGAIGNSPASFSKDERFEFLGTL